MKKAIISTSASILAIIMLTGYSMVLSSPADSLLQPNLDTSAINELYERGAVSARAAGIIEYSGELFRAGCNGLWGFVNENDEVIIPFEYERVGQYSEGLFSVGRNRKWGFVNIRNEVIIDFSYDYNDSYFEGPSPAFYDGLCAVRKNSMWGIINSSGDTIVDFIYQDVGDIAEGLIPLKQNDYWGFKDYSGNTVIDFIYTNITGESLGGDSGIFKGFRHGAIGVGVNAAYGVIDTTGASIIPLSTDFREVQCITDHLIFIRRASDSYGFPGKIALFDRNGSLLFEDIYTFRIERNGNILIGAEKTWLENRVSVFLDEYGAKIADVYQLINSACGESVSPEEITVDGSYNNIDTDLHRISIYLGYNNSKFCYINSNGMVLNNKLYHSAGNTDNQLSWSDNENNEYTRGYLLLHKHPTGYSSALSETEITEIYNSDGSLFTTVEGNFHFANSDFYLVDGNKFFSLKDKNVTEYREHTPTRYDSLVWYPNNIIRVMDMGGAFYGLIVHDRLALNTEYTDIQYDRSSNTFTLSKGAATTYVWIGPNGNVFELASPTSVPRPIPLPDPPAPEPPIGDESPILRYAQHLYNYLEKGGSGYPQDFQAYCQASNDRAYYLHSRMLNASVISSYQDTIIDISAATVSLVLGAYTGDPKQLGEAVASY